MEKNSEKKHLGTVTIIVKDRHSQAPDINQILTNHGHIILARLGVNVQHGCIENCTAMITVAVEGSLKEIKQLARELDQIYGIIAKPTIMTD